MRGIKMQETKLTRAAKWVVCVTGSLIMTVLCRYAFRYTYYMLVRDLELPLKIHDSMVANLLVLAAAAAVTGLLYLLEWRGSARLCSGILYGTLALAMVWVGAAGLWWITALDRMPEGDQAFIYAGATYFLEGEYGVLESYFARCPQNLGLAALIELFFHVVGPKNYYACQVVGVGFAVGIVWMGFRVVRQLTASVGVAIAYNILMFFCLPLIFYTNWVYGDLPSTFCILVAAWALMRYEKSGGRRYLALLVTAVTFAYLVRKNSMIVMIALLLVGAVHALAKRDLRLTVILGLCVVVPLLTFAGIVKMYELRSGITIGKGMSYVSYITMGTQVEEGVYGWYTEYCKDVWIDCDYDTSLASQVSWQDLKDNLEYFAENPSYAVTFYREKLLSQWDMPTYQSLFFAYKIGYDIEIDPAGLPYQLATTYYESLRAVCDRLQMVIYTGMLFYFLLGVRRERRILALLLTVAIIGGFLFSIIWEAKARYCFQYYLLMFPMAAVGWRLVLERAERVLRGIGRK